MDLGNKMHVFNVICGIIVFFGGLALIWCLVKAKIDTSVICIVAALTMVGAIMMLGFANPVTLKYAAPAISSIIGVIAGIGIGKKLP